MTTDQTEDGRFAGPERIAPNTWRELASEAVAAVAAADENWEARCSGCTRGDEHTLGEAEQDTVVSAGCRDRTAVVGCRAVHNSRC